MYERNGPCAKCVHTECAINYVPISTQHKVYHTEDICESQSLLKGVGNKFNLNVVQHALASHMCVGDVISLTLQPKVF